MLCSSCLSTLASLSRAAAKSAAARVRALGVLPVYRNWAARAAVCERCPLRVLHNNTSYCGQPLLNRIRRIDSVEGCGCPTHAKAKSPGEHCPLDEFNRPAVRDPNGMTRCTCKWCASG